jgi:hypothetical protein
MMRASVNGPILFAAAPQRAVGPLDGEFEATLRLVVSEHVARLLSDNIQRLRNCSFVVRIEGVE